MRSQYFYITSESLYDEWAVWVIGDIKNSLATQLDAPLAFRENGRINDAALRIKFYCSLPYK